MITPSNKKEPDSLDPEAQQPLLSRRRLLSLLASGGGTAAVLSAYGTMPAVLSMPPVSPAAPAGSPAFEGYSIFHETMIEMTWPEVKQAAQEKTLILLPIAPVEEHGPHMGLGVDIYLTYLVSKLTRRALEAKGLKTLIAPPFYWGLNVSTGAFPGSFTIREETMKAILYDIHNVLHQWGFPYVFSLNLHGDPTHKRVLYEAIREAHDKLSIGAYYLTSEIGLAGDERHVILFQEPRITGTLPQHTDVHAGASETALMAAFFPEDVRTDLAKTLKPNMQTFDPMGGYWGDPASFDAIDSAEIRKYMNDYCVLIADAIEAFLKKTQPDQ